jgi:hypothetical protein
MEQIRPTHGRSGVAAFVVLGFFLVACSHDPVTPAPVQMMGAGGLSTTRLPTGSVPRSAIGTGVTRQAISAPAPARPGPALERRHASIRQVAKGKHASRSRTTHGHSADRHIATAASSRTTTYGTGSIGTGPNAQAETIPLDELNIARGEAVVAPSASPSSSEHAVSTWVTPPPAEAMPSRNGAEFRPPSP